MRKEAVLPPYCPVWSLAWVSEDGGFLLPRLNPSFSGLELLEEKKKKKKTPVPGRVPNGTIHRAAFLWLSLFLRICPLPRTQGRGRHFPLWCVQKKGTSSQAFFFRDGGERKAGNREDYDGVWDSLLGPNPANEGRPLLAHDV